jgi:hypothetical protein
MRLLTLIALCFAMGCGRPAAAPPDRITIEGLITADPLPAGFVVTRKDVKQAGEIRATNLAVAKTDSSTRAVGVRSQNGRLRSPRSRGILPRLQRHG